MMRKLVIIVCSYFLTMSSFGQVKPDTNEVNIRLYQKIPMRDGVSLSCNIYQSAFRNQKLPVIVVYTPYVNDHNSERGMYFAKNGYVFVTIDIRGRGNSEGVFSGFDYCAEDGYDAVEWLAKQPFCDGRIGMMGGSWKGMSQWMTAKLAPPSLKTIVPTASVGPGIDFPSLNMIFSPYDVQWLSYVSGRTRNLELFGNSEFWNAKFKNFYINHLPFDSLYSLAGDNGWIFKKWIAHPTYDNYWKSIQPTPVQYAKMNIPILSITGYFDGDQPGAMNYYFNSMKYGANKGNHYLIIGPYNHGGTRKPKAQLNGLKFDNNAVLDIFKLHKDWFDYVFKDKALPAFLKDKVAYYSLPNNNWQYAGAYDSIATGKRAMYLTSVDANPNTVYNSGGLYDSYKSTNRVNDVLYYNPLDSIAVSEQDTLPYYVSNSYITDTSALYYQSRPFEKNITIFGQLKLSLTLQMTSKDADIEFEAYEVQPTGTSIYLAEGLMRTRFREGFEKESLPVQNTPFSLVILSNITHRTIQKGSMVRIKIKHSKSIYSSKNFGSGKDVSRETSKDAMFNTIKVLHSSSYSSFLEIPIVE